MIQNLRRFSSIFAMLLIAVAVHSAPAQTDSNQPRVTGEMAWKAGEAATPGATADLRLTLKIARGWHIQAGKGSGDEREPYHPTTVEIKLPAGWKAGAVKWPKAHVFTLGSGEFAETLAGYEGDAEILIPIQIPATAGNQNYSISAAVGYQPCDDHQCEFPTSTTIQGSLAIGSADSPNGSATSETSEAEAIENDVLPAEVFTGGVRVIGQVVWQESKLIPGSNAHLGILIDIAPGWHIQAGEGSGDDSKPFLATAVELQLPDRWGMGDVLWPEAQTFTIGKGDAALSFKGYSGRSLAVIPVTIPVGIEPGDYPLTVMITYQACDDEICEPETNESLRDMITVSSPDAPDREVDPAIAKRFQDVLARHPDAGGVIPPVLVRPDDPIDDSEQSSSNSSGDPADAAGANGAAEVGRPTFFGIAIPRPEGLLGLLLLAIFSALGGFILNLTPCVLPVIPIKIMTIMQHANKPGRNLVLGLWMAAGVIAFWVAIGLPVALFSTVTDPSQLFGIWWVTFGIGVLIAIMGIGIMGLFTLQLPQSVYGINPKADSPGGSFMFGVMTAVLGLPCFGFVAGALLAGSATFPPATIMIIFTALGVGMAAPYLVLSMKPGLVERIPRTGPASELVKQVMGLLLLAAAAYFIGAGLIALVSEMPWLARQLHWWGIALFVTLAALWLIVRTFQISRKPIPRITFLVIGILFCSVAIGYAADSTSKARVNWEAHAAALERSGAGEGQFASGTWNEYSPAAFQQAREAGYIVVADFTAEWCINCKFLKATVLNREPVKSELLRDDVVAFTVDLTSNRGPGREFLENLGQTGIPLLVIYSPDHENPWQSNAYTPQQVVNALEKARSQAVAQR